MWSFFIRSPSQVHFPCNFLGYCFRRIRKYLEYDITLVKVSRHGRRVSESITLYRAEGRWKYFVNKTLNNEILSFVADTFDRARRGTPREVAREITFRGMLAFFSRQNSLLCIGMYGGDGSLFGYRWPINHMLWIFVSVFILFCWKINVSFTLTSKEMKIFLPETGQYQLCKVCAGFYQLVKSSTDCCWIKCSCA